MSGDPFASLVLCGDGNFRPHPSDAQFAYIANSRELIANLRDVLGCPPGESLLYHAELVMAELHRLQAEARR